MILTRAGEYAVRWMLHLAGQATGQLIPRRQIPAAMEIPNTFRHKITQEHLAHEEAC